MNELIKRVEETDQLITHKLREIGACIKKILVTQDNLKER